MLVGVWVAKEDAWISKEDVLNMIVDFGRLEQRLVRLLRSRPVRSCEGRSYYEEMKQLRVVKKTRGDLKVWSGCRNGKNEFLDCCS